MAAHAAVRRGAAALAVLVVIALMAGADAQESKGERVLALPCSGNT